MSAYNPNPNHSEIQREQLASAISLRIYGVPLKEANTLKGNIARIDSGFFGNEIRSCLWKRKICLGFLDLAQERIKIRRQK